MTSELRAAQREGRTAVSLLVRVDYTGKDIANAGYSSAAPAGPTSATGRGCA